MSRSVPQTRTKQPALPLFTPDMTAALRERLLLLPFDALIQTVALLLERLGYQNIQRADRRDFRGRNGKAGRGGWELRASLPGVFPEPRGPLPHPVVQIKQCDGERLYQRAVDEVRGVALRLGAREALLVTTGPLSNSLTKVHPDLCLPPVRLVDGDALCRLMIQKGIGVTPEGDLDTAFFTHLEGRARGNGRADCSPGRQYLLKVSLEPVARSRRSASAAS